MSKIQTLRNALLTLAGLAMVAALVVTSVGGIVYFFRAHFAEVAADKLFFLGKAVFLWVGLLILILPGTRDLQDACRDALTLRDQELLRLKHLQEKRKVNGHHRRH